MNPEWLLKEQLKKCILYDADYERRYKCVLGAMDLAAQYGYKTGYRIDLAEPEWPVAFIELPTGQISWHMPQFPDAWDGHTTEQKFERIAEYVLGTTRNDPARSG